MSTETAPERYRRRNRLPVIAVVLLLLIGTAVVWATAMEPEAAAAKGCNVPGKPTLSATTSSTGSSDTAAPATDETVAGTTADTSTAATTITSLGVLVDKGTLISTRPANPATINLTVFNSTQTAGRARLLTDTWRAAGFESINPPKDDPLYPAKDLRCYGEIRYGEAGLNAARTVLMVAPCAQLVIDNRIDDSVEFALGERFDAASVPDTVINQLKAIRDAAAPPAVIEGQTASPRPEATIPPLPAVSCPD